MAMETPGQMQASHELARLAADSDGALIRVGNRMSPDGLVVDLRLNFSGCPTDPQGVELSDAEPVSIIIPDDYPFRYPEAEVEHNRFAGLPHVQWGHHICLYASSNDWDIDRGMSGFCEQLVSWYLAAAVGQLEGPDLPWHPPVEYASFENGCLMVSADLPSVPEQDPARTWVRWALLARSGEMNVDLIGWLDGDNIDWESITSQVAAFREASGGEPVFLAPVFGLNSPMTFEFPRRIGDLLNSLTARGLPKREFLHVLAASVALNAELGKSGVAGLEHLPLYVVIGSPKPRRSPGAEIGKFAAWGLGYVDDETLVRIADLVELPDLPADDSRAIALEELYGHVVDWVEVFDQRPEAVVRRDHGRPVEWLRGRRVLVLGCGALGAPIAEHCARAGASSLRLVDYALVSPGLLVRQPYDHRHIGFPKAFALAERVRGVRPALQVESDFADALNIVPGPGSRPPDVDLIIDATADRATAAKIERYRHENGVPWPPLLTVVLGHQAERGIGMVSLPRAVGAGTDILRRILVEQANDARLTDVVEDFFPDPPRAEVFQPEPGCSDPTFVGSAADVQAIAAQLLSSSIATVSAWSRADRDQETRPPESSATIVRPLSSVPWLPSVQELRWERDVIVADPLNGYQIRLSVGAIDEMRRHAGIAAQAGGQSETGGSLLGQFDSACRVVWVSVADGPPPGSVASPVRMEMNPANDQARLEARRIRSRGALSFVGLWHTHPGGPAMPSTRDVSTMGGLLDGGEPADMTNRALLLIVAGAPDPWACFLRGEGPPDLYGEVHLR